MAKKPVPVTTLSFKEALQSLDSIAQEIESNPLELEELVTRYEQGMHILTHCRSILEDTKKRLIILNQLDAQPNGTTPAAQKHDDDDLFRLS